MQAKGIRRVAPWLGAIALVAAGMTAAQAAASHPTPRYANRTSPTPSGGAATGFKQVTGERMVGTPSTTPCVENIVTNYPFKNTAYGPDKNFSGPYDPPTACPGPWSRVVATIHVKITGVQFDRVGDLRLGDTDVWAYSTAEPRGDGTPNVEWTKSHDITDYTSLLLQHQQISYEIGNVVTGPYDGIYYGSLRLTFYPVDASNPEPASVPDVVQPVIREAQLSSDTTQADGSFTLAPDTTSLTGDLIVQGHGGCDEFWWADAPPPFPGQCGGPPYREAEVFVDGTLAGIVEPYPYLFTGANGPSWWEPVSAPQTMNLRPWRLNLTPFVGLLTDGQSHTLSVKMLDWNAGSGDFFRVNLALFSDTSGTGEQTTGGLTSVVARKHATIQQHATATNYQLKASHALTAVGWYQVGSGPVVTTTVEQRIGASSFQNVSTGVRNIDGYSQSVRTQTAPVGGGKGSVVKDVTVRNNKLFSLAHGWSLEDTETEQQTHNGSTVFQSLRNDRMTSTQASGHFDSFDHWRYADTTGSCGTTTVTGDNGAIASIERTPRCVWTPGLQVPAVTPSAT